MYHYTTSLWYKLMFRLKITIEGLRTVVFVSAFWNYRNPKSLYSYYHSLKIWIRKFQMQAMCPLCNWYGAYYKLTVYKTFIENKNFYLVDYNIMRQYSSKFGSSMLLTCIFYLVFLNFCYWSVHLPDGPW